MKELKSFPFIASDVSLSFQLCDCLIRDPWSVGKWVLNKLILSVNMHLVLYYRMINTQNVSIGINQSLLTFYPVVPDTIYCSISLWDHTFLVRQLILLLARILILALNGIVLRFMMLIFRMVRLISIVGTSNRGFLERSFNPSSFLLGRDLWFRLSIELCLQTLNSSFSVEVICVECQISGAHISIEHLLAVNLRWPLFWFDDLLKMNMNSILDHYAI